MNGTSYATAHRTLLHTRRIPRPFHPIPLQGEYQRLERESRLAVIVTKRSLTKRQVRALPSVT